MSSTREQMVGVRLNEVERELVEAAAAANDLAPATFARQAALRAARLVLAGERCGTRPSSKRALRVPATGRGEGP